MKTVKDKYLVVGADFAGYPLKEVVVEHLEKKGWKILDLGVKKDSDPKDTDLMFHRVGLRVGSEISEGNYERALLFCGTGKLSAYNNGNLKLLRHNLKSTGNFTNLIYSAGVILSFGLHKLKVVNYYKSQILDTAKLRLH